MTTEIDYMQGLIGGLVTQARTEATQTRHAWPLTNNPDPTLAVPPAHCWRTVGQRTLDHPVTWLAEVQMQAGAPNYSDVLDAMELPTTPLVDLDTNDTAQVAPFYKNRVQPDRSSINGLVLIALRARMVVGYAGKRDLISQPDYRKSNAWSRAIPAFARHYLSFRITHTAGRRDPWVSDTPLAYIDRPDGSFVTVPPLIWNTRDTTVEWVSRSADHGAASGLVPTLAQLAGGDLELAMSVTASLLVEGLFVPDPEECGAQWPGLWCPSEAIAGHPKHDRNFLRRRYAKLAGMLNKK